MGREASRLLADLGVVGFDQAINASHGTTASISERNFSHLVYFLAVVTSSSEKPSCLPPIKAVLACDHGSIVARKAWFSRASLVVSEMTSVMATVQAAVITTSGHLFSSRPLRHPPVVGNHKKHYIIEATMIKDPASLP